MGALQSHYDAEFSRDMGCTETEWLAWLPAAIGAHEWQRMPQGASVNIVHNGILQGSLSLTWSALPPRQIARVRIPRLWVHFEFKGLQAEQRNAFMRRFDVYMHRGGG